MVWPTRLYNIGCTYLKNHTGNGCGTKVCFKKMFWIKKTLSPALALGSPISVQISGAHTLALVSRGQVNGANVATVSLNHPPVNSLNIPFTIELTKILREIEDSGDIKAVIFESSLPKVFSAGLDLNELYNKPRKHMELFWRSFQDLWFQVYSSKLVTLSVIGGHCLAAGTVIAAACDYRLGVKGQYAIGVPAVKVGLVAPPWFLTTLCDLMGKRKTELAIQTGKTFSPSEALENGLIDRVCTATQANIVLLEVLETYLSVNQLSRSTMKHYLRAELIDSYECKREHDMHDFVDYVSKDSVQKMLCSYIQSMKKS